MFSIVVFLAHFYCRNRMHELSELNNFEARNWWFLVQIKLRIFETATMHIEGNFQEKKLSELQVEYLEITRTTFSSDLRQFKYLNIETLFFNYHFGSIRKIIIGLFKCFCHGLFWWFKNCYHFDKQSAHNVLFNWTVP